MAAVVGVRDLWEGSVGKSTCLGVCAIALVFPMAALADLNQTVTLSTSGTSNLNLDTGATASSGGDIQFSSTGITPQGNAKAINIGLATPASFAVVSQTVAEFYPGYSSATITIGTLETTLGTLSDEFLVHTNGGHYAKLLVTGSTSSTITLMLTTFGVSAGGSTAGPPVITSIQNNSSNIFSGLPNYGIAPSSIFVIVGTGLADPGTPVLQSSAPPGLPSTLNGASISATVNGVTVHPAIYYTSPTQIAAVLPASTPVGTGTLTVTYKGAASNAAPLEVVPAALGINTFYTNSAVATDAVSGALITYTNAATPGETLTLWTTGLGTDPSDSDTTYSATPHAVHTPLQIYVGGVPATILYQGSAGYPGVDQINLTIPASTPDGCWTSILAVSSGVLSNIDTLPVKSGGGACVDTVSGLRGDQITPSSQTLRTGLVTMGQTTSTALNGTISSSSFSDAAFEKYQGIYSPSNPISPGGCLVNNTTPVSVGTLAGLDPGSISLSGTGGIALTMANQAGIKGAFYGLLADGAIPQSGGTFTFKGTGGADVGSFSSTLTFSNPLISWTNQNSATSVDRGKDLTVTWTGGNPGSFVYILGSSRTKATSTIPSITAGFTCLTKVEDGKFTVPSYILSALPAGTGAVQIQNSISAPLPASGLDIATALGAISITIAATFQ